jgi:hypothetical protein
VIMTVAIILLMFVAIGGAMVVALNHAHIAR